MSKPSELKSIFTETVRICEQLEDMAEELAAFRDAATEKGFDWSQLKALAKAHVKDTRKGEHKLVEKIITKADFAASYADQLGLRQHERETETRSSKVWEGRVANAVPRLASRDNPPAGGKSLERERLDGSIPLPQKATSQSFPEPAPAGSHSALAIAPAPSTADMRAGATLSHDGIPPFLDRRVLST